MMSNTIYESKAYVHDRLGHLNDADTYIDFGVDTITMAAGGEALTIDSDGNIKNTGGTTTTHTIFADSGSSEGTANITFNTDGASTDQAVANIQMTQDGGTSQKGEIYFQVSDNGAPATAIKIANNKDTEVV